MTQLPSGYQGMFPLAHVPPPWFRVIDSRLLAVPQADGDVARVNVDPARRKVRYRKYGPPSTVTA